jgi:hypothetical protein
LARGHDEWYPVGHWGMNEAAAMRPFLSGCFGVAGSGEWDPDIRLDVDSVKTVC